MRRGVRAAAHEAVRAARVGGEHACPRCAQHGGGARHVLRIHADHLRDIGGKARARGDGLRRFRGDHDGALGNHELEQRRQQRVVRSSEAQVQHLRFHRQHCRQGPGEREAVAFGRCVVGGQRPARTQRVHTRPRRHADDPFPVVRRGRDHAGHRGPVRFRRHLRRRRLRHEVLCRSDPLAQFRVRGVDAGVHDRHVHTASCREAMRAPHVE